MKFYTCTVSYSPCRTASCPTAFAPRRGERVYRALAIVLSALLVSACGQRGPLYLRDKPPAEAKPAPGAALESERRADPEKK